MLVLVQFSMFENRSTLENNIATKDPIVYVVAILRIVTKKKKVFTFLETKVFTTLPVPRFRSSA